MREITITLTEQDLLETTGRTLEEITDVNGYQTVVPNPDYVPAQGSETMTDPAWDGQQFPIPQVPNPDYVPAVGEPTIPNPEKRTAFLAKKLAAAGMRILSEPLRKQAIRNAEREANELFDGSITALLDRAKIVITE